jgi:signal transduction histidine kinase
MPAMTYVNETLFLTFALVLAGLFISSLPYFSKRTSSMANQYWLLAIGLDIFAFLLFAAVSTVGLLLLTFANTFFFASYFFLFIFCRQLNEKPVKKLVNLSPVLFLAFGSAFEYLRQFGVFQDRVLFVIGCLIVCLIGVLIELLEVRKREPLIQINFLIVTFTVEIVLGVARVWILLQDTSVTSSNLLTEPFLTSLIRWFAVAFTVLSFISINGFWAEKLAQSNAKNFGDSRRVSKLLDERDSLIASLLKANKSSSTEALSASIAHELNQPLAATLLNIQHLKMLHESDKLRPELLGPIVDQLEKDTKRAGEVIRSLRSIFIKDSGLQEVIQVQEVLDNAVAIYKSELVSKKIKLQLTLNGDAVILCHKGQFLQVLLNLINNAIQALSSADSSHKLIVLRDYQDGANYVLEISDNGPGVPGHEQSYLFQLLSSDKSSGMGVGLWLCAHIMSHAGGKISYQDATGGGAKFILSFPPVPRESIG